uniref:Uncharacterized protein n=1 Tax=Anguilla anguilla TaxID=7936 RepID=A0A0E9TI65_ANGAN
MSPCSVPANPKFIFEMEGR